MGIEKSEFPELEGIEDFNQKQERQVVENGTILNERNELKPEEWSAEDEQLRNMVECVRAIKIYSILSNIQYSHQK